MLAAADKETVKSKKNFDEIERVKQHLKTKKITVDGTIDTGQGANELYDMDQNVLTTSDVIFDDISITTALTSSNTELDISTHIAVPAGSRVFVDGGGVNGNTGMYQSSTDVLTFFAGGTNYLSIYQTHPDILVGTHLHPDADDSSARQLGSTNYYWYGLWYGAGGLNQKPCFRDLKTNIKYKNIKNMYDTLPRYGSFTRLSNMKAEVGFIIDDVSNNRDEYEYVGKEDSISLTKIVAQMAQCIKDLNERIKILEK